MCPLCIFSKAFNTLLFRVNEEANSELRKRLTITSNCLMQKEKKVKPLQCQNETLQWPVSLLQMFVVELGQIEFSEIFHVRPFFILTVKYNF